MVFKFVVYFFKKTISLLFQSLLAIEILILIGTLPTLLRDFSFQLPEYIHTVYRVTIRIFALDHLTLDGKNSLFPFILERYFDSMRIMGLGIGLAFFIAFLFAYVSLIFFRKKTASVKRILELFESIPDLIYILLLQMAVIVIFRKTGIKLAQVVTVQEKTILLPVISISIPISFYITKVLLHLIEEELKKDYVMLVKAKGFSFIYILNIHVLRNLTDELFGMSKTIFWSMLSTLVVIDYLFNMNGLLMMMLSGTDAFIVGCILLFIPFFILYRGYEWLSFSRRKEGN